MGGFGCCCGSTDLGLWTHGWRLLACVIRCAWALGEKWPLLRVVCVCVLLDADEGTTDFSFGYCTAVRTKQDGYFRLFDVYCVRVLVCMCVLFVCCLLCQIYRSRRFFVRLEFLKISIFGPAMMVSDIYLPEKDTTGGHYSSLRTISDSQQR